MFNHVMIGRGGADQRCNGGFGYELQADMTYIARVEIQQDKVVIKLVQGQKSHLSEER